MQSVIEEVWEAVDWWGKCISMTGGALVPSKSYWGLLKYQRGANQGKVEATKD
jgi:hypothetical protein